MTILEKIRIESNIQVPAGLILCQGKKRRTGEQTVDSAPIKGQ